MTREEYSKLSEEQKQKAVAVHLPRLCHCGIPGVGFCPVHADYLNDLNAMHEAENRLSKEDHDSFCDVLVQIASKDGEAYSATAAQRAEAFVLTMEPEE